MTDASHLQLLVNIARDHYLLGKSKVELSNAYNISRFHVARLLDEARALGIVRIEVGLPANLQTPGESDLATRLGIDRLIIAGSSDDFEANRPALAKATAREIETACTAGQTLGISWSRTLDAAVQDVTSMPKVNLVQLAGALPTNSSASPFELVQRLRNLSGGHAWPLWAPLIVDSAPTARGLRSQPEIKAALAQANHLDAAVVAIGAWAPERSTVWDYVGAKDHRAATRAGAIAECSARLFDRDGRPVDTELDERVIAVTLEQLAKTPKVIAVARGMAAAEGILAAAKGGFITTAIVDSPLASRLSELLGDAA